MAKNAQGGDEDGPSENIDLEASFPDASEVFKPYAMQALTGESVLFMLDTNVLLLPYQTTQDDLAAIGVIYKKLADQGRLFIAARAAREFAKHRDRKLADMVKTIGEIKSRLPSIDKRISPLLVGLPGHNELDSAYDELMKSKVSYAKALDPLIETVRNWKGDDPVSKMYSELFTVERVVEPTEKREDLAQEWKARSDAKRPPGYKDSSKPDGGIGDFLIWKAALALAEKEKKDLVFVTNETKPDWFVRSNRDSLYPRLELIDEYRRHSGGQKLRLCSLHQMLREMNADEKVVQEVRTAEVVANSAVTISSSHRRIMSGDTIFDYSKDNGRTSIIYGYQKYIILKFSKAGERSIYLYRDAPNTRIARIKSPQVGGRVYFDELDSSSSNYNLQLGDGFAIMNPDGYMLVGRIIDIKDDRYGHPNDEVRFLYNLTGPDDPGEVP